MWLIVTGGLLLRCCCQGPTSSSSVEDSLRQELNSQREVSARLRQDLAAARQQLHEQGLQWDEQQTNLQETLQQRELELQRVQLELQQRPTSAHVTELQQQIRILQAVGYGSLPEEFSAAAAGVAGAAGSGSFGVAGMDGSGIGGSDSGGRGSEPGVRREGSQGGAGGIYLEGLLLAKNRKLEHDVTVARLGLAEAKQQLESAQEQVGGWFFGVLTHILSQADACQRGLSPVSERVGQAVCQAARDKNGGWKLHESRWVKAPLVLCERWLAIKRFCLCSTWHDQ